MNVSSSKPKLLVAALCATLPLQFAQAFQLPGLPNIPTNFNIPGVTPQRGNNGNSNNNNGAGTTDINPFAVGGVCALVGAGGALLGKRLAQNDASRLKLTPAQAKSREASYMLGWGLAGCAVGGGAAAMVLKNMSASAKAAQDDAWRKAQQQTGPVAWQDPNNPKTRGTTEITERELLPSGSECGTRRDVIEAEEGKAEPTLRVCRTAAGGDWSPVVS